MKSWPDRSQVQGNVWPGFNKDHQTNVLLSFPDPAAGRLWISRIAGDIASAEEVSAFNELYKFVAKRRPSDWSRFIRATWINVAFSWSGLRRLGMAEIDGFPRSFMDNAAPGPTDALPGVQDHALLLVAADAKEDLQSELRRQLAILRECGINDPVCWDGHRLEGRKEHFGFRDGISQPALRGLDDEPDSGGAWVPAEEFVLRIQPDADARRNEPAWADHGSYLVFLKLQQDVAAFRGATKDATRGGQAEGKFGQAPRISKHQLAAMLMGRWPSGVPVGESLGGIADVDPENWTPAQRRREAPGFPFASHIGRSNPRQLGSHATSPHRLLRRGITYGDQLEKGKNDNQERGLLFLAYQADIAAQFGFVWNRWLNGPAPGLDDRSGTDPVVGQVEQGGGIRHAWIPDATLKGGGISLELPRFVTTRYAGYFFAPSIGALKNIAADVSATRTTIPMATQDTYSLDDARRDLNILIQQTPAELLAGGRLLQFLEDLFEKASGASRNPTAPVQLRQRTPSDSPTGRPIYSNGKPLTADAKQIPATEVDLTSLVIEQNPYLTEELVKSGNVTFELDAVAQGPAAADQYGYTKTQYPKSLVKLINDAAAAAAQSADPAKSEDDVLRHFMYWQFDGLMERISKAVRVTYRIPADPGDKRDKITGVVYIGYGGPPWP